MTADRWMGYALTAPLVLIVGGACLAVALDTLHAIAGMFRRPREPERTYHAGSTGSKTAPKCPCGCGMSDSWHPIYLRRHGMKP